MPGNAPEVFRRPRSVGVVGCRPLPSTAVGAWILHNLLLHAPGFNVYPINPDHQEIGGQKCYKTVSQLPEPPDLLLVAAPREQSLTALRDAEAAGTSGAIVFGSKSGGDDKPHFEDMLRQFAQQSKMPICGPGTNGFFNVSDMIACTSAPFAAKPDPPHGDVAIVSHSGALVTSMVERLTRNGLGLTYTCAVGKSVGIGMPDFISLIANDEVTRTILIYAEGIPDRDSFFAGADTAIAAGKQVVVFKAGKSIEGRTAIREHTGILASASEAFQAACERHGIILAADFDEFVTLPALLHRRPRRRQIRKVGIASGSGAIGIILTDVARSHGFQVPSPDSSSVAAVSLAPGITMANPLDLTVHDPEACESAIRTLAADISMDAIVFGIQAGPAAINQPVHGALAATALDGKEVLVWSASGTTASEESILASAHIPVIPSAETLFRCLRKIVDAKASVTSAAGISSRRASARAEAARRLLEPLTHGPVPAEVAWQVLALYDIPILREHPVTEGDAVRVAGKLGYPVVAKLRGLNLPHKSDFGYVKLGLNSDDATQDAVRELSSAGIRNGHHETQVVLQRQADTGCELILAARSDCDAGPHVVVGIGGIFAEILADTKVESAPVPPDDIQAMLEGLRGAPLLTGFRGTGRKALTSLCAAIYNISELAADLCGPLAFLEINPLIVDEAGALAVDVLASLM